MPIPEIPLSTSDLNLDISGVAGFFGGDVAVSAMGTVHVYQRRKWLGWYNSPGSYEIAKRYGQLGTSRFWDGLLRSPPGADPSGAAYTRLLALSLLLVGVDLLHGGPLGHLGVPPAEVHGLVMED